MDFKENAINFFSILELLRGPIVWPSRARFGPQAANLDANFLRRKILKS